MKYFKNLCEFIIKISFHFSVWLIERFHDMKKYERQVEKLRKLKEGTLGREIAACLDQHKLRLVPGYESHDLKHTLLDFKMTAVDEIRMQAFMIGNGNLSIPSVAIFIFGFTLLPYKWSQFAKDFYKGFHSKSIKDWTIDEYANRDLDELRRILVVEEKETNLIIRIAYSGSIMSIIAGAVGMIYCLPYLFSPVLEDLVGAGFPFVGGAILFIGGLISLTVRSYSKLLQ